MDTILDILVIFGAVLVFILLGAIVVHVGGILLIVIIVLAMPGAVCAFAGWVIDSTLNTGNLFTLIGAMAPYLWMLYERAKNA